MASPRLRHDFHRFWMMGTGQVLHDDQVEPPPAHAQTLRRHLPAAAPLCLDKLDQDTAQRQMCRGLWVTDAFRVDQLEMEPQLLALHESIRRVPSHADRAKEAAPAHETEAGPAGETGAAAGASLGVLNRAGAFVAPSSRDDGLPKMDLGTIGTVDPYVVLTCCGSQVLMLC